MAAQSARVIAVEHKGRADRAELLPPEAWHEGQLQPVAVKVWWEPNRFCTVVKLEDGGVWALPDRALDTIDPGDVRANIAEIFARWPGRFQFRRRERASYRRRT